VTNKATRTEVNKVKNFPYLLKFMKCPQSTISHRHHERL